MLAFGAIFLISVEVYSNFQHDQAFPEIYTENSQYKSEIKIIHSDDYEYLRVRQMSKSDKLSEFILLICEIYGRGEIDGLKISKEIKKYAGISVPVDAAISRIRSNEYFLSMDDMGSYYAVRFKGKYNISPIIGFSIMKDGVINLPYVQTKVGE